MKRLNLKSLREKTLGLIYPENLYCMACGDTIEGTTRIHGLCDECIKKTDWSIENPYAEVMEDFAFDQLWTCCRYGYLPRRVMNGLKEKGRTYYVKNLGLLMSERVLQGFEEEGLDAEDFDMVLAVPMTLAKEAQRGYNQAELLALEVCNELSMPYYRDVLVKPVETPSMRYSDGRTRRTVLAGAFTVRGNQSINTASDRGSQNAGTISAKARHDADNSGARSNQDADAARAWSNQDADTARAWSNQDADTARAWSNQDADTASVKVLSGKRVLLVDDVSTTGSTFDACARVLKEAGAAKVICLCFASVGFVKDDYVTTGFMK